MALFLDTRLWLMKNLCQGLIRIMLQQEKQLDFEGPWVGSTKCLRIKLGVLASRSIGMNRNGKGKDKRVFSTVSSER